MTYLAKQERRKSIIQAALSLVDKVGFGGLTTRSIAQELGTAPGTIHHNFASLTELKCAALAHVVDNELKRNEEVIAECAPQEALFRILAPAPVPGNTSALRIWISAADEANRSAEVAEIYSGAVNKWHSQLTGFIRTHFSSACAGETACPEDLAWKLLAMSTSLNDLLISPGIKLTREHVRQLVREEIAKLVPAAPAPR